MTRTILLLTVAALALAACGPKAPPPAPNVPKNVPPVVRVNNPPPIEQPKPDKRGTSYLKEYKEASQAAFAAKLVYDKAKQDYDKTRQNDPAKADKNVLNEPYVTWAVSLYQALMYANKHEHNGYALSELPNLKDLKSHKGGDLKYALGPSDDPRVKKAQQEWEKSTTSGQD